MFIFVSISKLFLASLILVSGMDSILNFFTRLPNIKKVKERQPWQNSATVFLAYRKR